MKKNNKTGDPIWNETHYVCSGGCKFISNDYGRCMSIGCVRARNPLSECKCTDNKHLPWITYNVPKN